MRIIGFVLALVIGAATAQDDLEYTDYFGLTVKPETEFRIDGANRYYTWELVLGTEVYVVERTFNSAVTQQVFLEGTDELTVNNTTGWVELDITGEADGTTYEMWSILREPEFATAKSTPIQTTAATGNATEILDDGLVANWVIYDDIPPITADTPIVQVTTNGNGARLDGDDWYNGMRRIFDTPTAKPVLEVEYQATNANNRVVFFIAAQTDQGEVLLRYDTESSSPNAPNFAFPVENVHPNANDGTIRTVQIPIKQLMEDNGFTYSTSTRFDAHSLVTIYEIKGIDAVTQSFTAPELFISVISDDDHISAQDDDAAVPLAGTTLGVDNGNTVTVTIQGVDYTATVANNAWSTTMPATDAQALSTGVDIEVTASVTVSNANDYVATDETTITHSTTAVAATGMSRTSVFGVVDDRGIKAHPGAEGWSQDARGGRVPGTQLVVVNSTSCDQVDGDGLVTFPEAIEAVNEAQGGPDNARMIGFAIGGLAPCLGGDFTWKGNATVLGHTAPQGDGVRGSPTPGGFRMVSHVNRAKNISELIVRGIGLYGDNNPPSGLETGSPIRTTGSGFANNLHWNMLETMGVTDNIIIGYGNKGFTLGQQLISNIGITHSYAHSPDNDSLHPESVRDQNSTAYNHAHGVGCSNANPPYASVSQCSIIGNWVNDTYRRVIRSKMGDRVELIGNLLTNPGNAAIMIANRSGKSLCDHDNNPNTPDEKKCPRGIPSMNAIVKHNRVEWGPTTVAMGAPTTFATTFNNGLTLDANGNLQKYSNDNFLMENNTFRRWAPGTGLSATVETLTPEHPDDDPGFTENTFHTYPKDWDTAKTCIGLPDAWIDAFTAETIDDVINDSDQREIGIGRLTGVQGISDGNRGRHFLASEGGDDSYYPDTFHSYANVNGNLMPDSFETAHDLPLNRDSSLDVYVDGIGAIPEANATPLQLTENYRVIELYNQYVARLGCGNDAVVTTPTTTPSYAYGHSFSNWYIGNTAIGGQYDYQPYFPFTAKTSSTVTDLLQYWIWEWGAIDPVPGGYGAGDGGNIKVTIVSDNNGQPNLTDVYSELTIAANVDHVAQTSNLALQGRAGAPTVNIPFNNVIKPVVEGEKYYVYFQGNPADPDNYLGINGHGARVNVGGGLEETPQDWAGSQGNSAATDECRIFATWGTDGQDRNNSVRDHCSMYQLTYADNTKQGYGIIGGRDEEQSRNLITGANDYIRQAFTLPADNNIRNISINVARLDANPTGNLIVEVMDTDGTTVLLSDSVPLSSVRQQEDPIGTPNDSGFPYSHQWIDFDITDTVLTGGVQRYIQVRMDNNDRAYMYGAQLPGGTYSLFDLSAWPFEGGLGQITDDGGATWVGPWRDATTNSGDVVFPIFFNEGYQTLN